LKRSVKRAPRDLLFLIGPFEIIHRIFWCCVRSHFYAHGD
jgi:hypothetical protein